MSSSSIVLDLTVPSSVPELTTVVHEITVPSLPQDGKPHIPCKHCDQSFTNRSNMKRHINNIHPEKAGHKVECLLCGGSFSGKVVKGKVRLVKHNCSGVLRPAPLQHPPLPVHSVSAPAVPLPLSPAGVSQVSVVPAPAIQSQSVPMVPAPAIQSAPPTPPKRRGHGELLLDEDIDGPAEDFYRWLGEKPKTPMEQMVKKARAGIWTPSKVKGETMKLRNLVRKVNDLFPDLFKDGVRLPLLIGPEVVKAVFEDIENRGVESTRYPTALLLKKTILWISRRQSKASGTLVAPDDEDLFPAWDDIIQHAEDGTRDRKFKQEERIVKGLGTEKWMRGEEMEVVLNACSAKLIELKGVTGPGQMLDPRLMQDWMDHFITALLLTCHSPRKDTYENLTVGNVVPPGGVRCPEQYSLEGIHRKTNKPWWSQVPVKLTGAMKFHLEQVLPSVRPGSPLFLQRCGEARADISIVSARVCFRYIGRPITAGKFRISTITEVRDRPGVNSRSLARLYGHSEDTQRNYYDGTDYAQQGQAVGDWLTRNMQAV